MPSTVNMVAALIGAGLVDAIPRPQFFGASGGQQFSTFSFPGFGYPTGTPTGFSVPPQPSSSGIAPVSSSAPGSSFGLTGTGYSYSASACSVSYITPSRGSVPASSISASIVPGGPIAPVSSGAASIAPSTSPSSVIVEDSSGSVAAASSTAAASAAPSSAAQSFSAPTSAATSTAAASSVAASSIAPSSAGPSAAAPSAPATSVTASSGCTFTDADAAASGKASCTSIVLSGITVPAGTTLDMTNLKDGTTVSFEGTTTFEYAEWEGPLISFSGSSITITGASGHVIDGNGAKWWDGQGSNGGVTKPKFFYAHDLTDSVISGLNVKNTPVQGFSVDGAQNLKIEDVTIDDSAGDSEGGHNTDCFDIGDSTGVYLSGITCKNQDDCIAINSGTDIQFTGGTCSGGHGLSIGSVGGRDDNTVENIYIASSSISASENGVRIKCNSGDTGSVKNVTYESITLSGITDYGIVIEQDYENGSPTGTPTNGIPITEVTLTDITGSVSADAQAYYILCAACSDWTVSGVSVSGGSESKSCEGVPSGVSLC